MANNISLSDILSNRPDFTPTIYGYILPDVKDHDGYIKIGYTEREIGRKSYKRTVAYRRDRL